MNDENKKKILGISWTMFIIVMALVLALVVGWLIFRNFLGISKNQNLTPLPVIVTTNTPSTAGGIGTTSTTPFFKPGDRATSTGKLLFEPTLKGYLIIGDPQFPNSLYIKNSSDKKVADVLKPLVGKKITISGTITKQGLGNVILLDTVNSKPI